jgi:hypothetical protein
VCACVCACVCVRVFVCMCVKECMKVLCRANLLYLPIIK